MKTLKLCLATLLFAASAWATDVYITLDAPTLTASPGDLLSFNGTITSEHMVTIDLNDISVSLAGMLLVDETSFLLGPPTVDPLGTTVDFTLFTVAVNAPYTDPLGPVNGTITILGGLESGNVYDPTATSYLGQTGFTVDVATPEISTAWMLLPGVTCLWLIRRRRRTVGCGPTQTLVLVSCVLYSFTNTRNEAF